MQPLSLIRAGCVVALLIGISTGCGRRQAAGFSPNRNDNVPTTHPPVYLLDLDGKAFDLWKHQNGRVAVAVFTRTDCPISNRFAPEIRRVVELNRSNGVDFYLIYVDPDEQPDAIRQHLRDYQYSCTALRDTQHALVAYCGATVTPEAVVFNADYVMIYRGRVCDQYVDLGVARSEAGKHDLADAIDAAFAGKPVAMSRTRAVGCPISDLTP